MSTLRVIFSGFITGSVMTVPGISGGSAAMVIGIYDDLVRAVSRLFSEPRKNIPLLIKFTIGAVAGIVLIARAVSWLLTTPAEIPVRFMFMGAVAGGIPMIFRQAGVKKMRSSDLLLILAGVSVALLLSALPGGIFAPGNRGVTAVILQFTGGILLAAALVLPGLSASHFLYLLGIYDTVMEMLAEFNILSLLPLFCGLVLGTFLTARVLETLIQRHQKGTFLVILGFMLASLRELYPHEASGIPLFVGIPCIIVGFVPVYYLQTKHTEKNK